MPPSHPLIHQGFGNARATSKSTEIRSCVTIAALGRAERRPCPQITPDQSVLQSRGPHGPGGWARRADGEGGHWRPPVATVRGWPCTPTGPPRPEDTGPRPGPTGRPGTPPGPRNLHIDMPRPRHRQTPVGKLSFEFTTLMGKELPGVAFKIRIKEHKMLTYLQLLLESQRHR